MSWLSTEFFYYKGSPPCRAAWLTIKALNIEVEMKHVDLLKAENKRPWFVRISPMQQLPTFNDHSFILWESRAIMQYICNKFGTEETQNYYPKDPEERAKVDRLLFFDIGTFYHAICEYFKPKLYHGMPPDMSKENLMKQSLEYLDHFIELGGGPYAAGDKLTIADFALIASISELDALEYNYRYYGEVARWSDKIKKEVPFYEECTKEGIEITKQRIKQLEEVVRKEIEEAEKKPSGPAKTFFWE